MKTGAPKYPLGTIIAYGPDDKLAAKLVVSVFKNPGHQEPDELHRWISQAGDVRKDLAIMAEVTEFLKRHGVRQTVTYDRILGCPHEEGIDYPEGGTCPHCPFWENIDRFTHKPKKPQLSEDASSSSPRVGRNDPCPCGSGKKFKKCCGR